MAPMQRQDLPQGMAATSNSGNFYGTSFDPERYKQLRGLVQTQGWNTLLGGVTFESGGHIVDLGFGDGAHTAELAHTLRHRGLSCLVFGVEKSGEMVREARASYPDRQNPNLIFLEGAAEEAGAVLREHFARQGITPTEPPIGYVISNYTLHWVRDPDNPARFRHEERFRSLNSLQPIGGVQRHFCAHADTFSELFAAGYQTIEQDSTWRQCFSVRSVDYSEQGMWRHPPLVQEAAILGALHAAGYRGTVTLHTDVREFPNAAVLKDWVRVMIRPFMERVPENGRLQFVNDWIAHYCASTRQDPEGPCRLFDRNILVVAHKERELH